MEDGTIFNPTSTEPTNDELWQQLPARMNFDSKIAKLARARELYEELSGAQCALYDQAAMVKLTDVTKLAADGDVHQEAASQIEAAIASELFDSFRAYVFEGVADTAVVGTITTVTGERYFRINPAVGSAMSTAKVSRRARQRATREWWSENYGSVLIVLGICLLIAWPIVLGAMFSWWWLLALGAEAFIIGITAAFASL